MTFMVDRKLMTNNQSIMPAVPELHACRQGKNNNNNKKPHTHTHTKTEKGKEKEKTRTKIPMLVNRIAW